MRNAERGLGTHLHEVPIAAESPERFAAVLAEERMARAREVAGDMRERMRGRVFWNINSTAMGGGVAELLASLVRYARGAGVDARWVVIRGSPEFFRITKRIHHALHNSRGDGSPLGEAERRAYEQTLRSNLLELSSIVRSNDIVLLHDPQTAGLAPGLAHSGAMVIWRCHIGDDVDSPEADAGWRFLSPYLESVDHFVFSRRSFVPGFLPRERTSVIAPSIDAFSAKNQELSKTVIHSVLVHAGLVEGPLPHGADYSFVRADGTPGRVERRADVIRMGRAPARETPLAVQVARWDALKDPIGVMRGFSRIVDGVAPAGAELVLAGPNVHGVADDPEAVAVFAEVLQAWRSLPHHVRDKIHLACLPSADVEENALMVNALQRHAAVVLQKSLHEGFGLTVTEAMWKARPVIASAIGGIQDQIEHAKSGWLLPDPSDLEAFGDALRRLLGDPRLATQLGQGARERVRDRYLGIRHLLEYAQLIERLDATRR